MPSVLRLGPYRIYFHSHEPNEPPHVHIDRDDLSCKFWLNPVRISYNLGFSPGELRKVERIIQDNRQKLLEDWNAYFGY